LGGVGLASGKEGSMPIDRDLIDRLRARGEEVFTQISAELMQNPRFVKTMEGAMRGKERVDDVVRQVMKKTDIPTRTEFKKALARIEELEEEVAALKKKVASRPRTATTRRKTARSAASASRKSAKKTS
jgi:polyhydroxyalkanoate synthesis regulator phasin